MARFGMKIATIGLAVGAMLIASAPDAQARDFATIMKPYSDRYGKWQNIRKAMRKRQKAGETFNADDWFVLAAMCAIEPPSSGSMIRDAMRKSPCKDDVVPYFVKAGEMGEPRGFNQAAYYARTRDSDQARSWYYAQLAYQLSGNDSELASDAQERMAEVSLSPSAAEQMRLEANATAMKLVANGVYGGTQVTADTRVPGTGLPELKWLDFKNPARCGWSDAAMAVIEGSFGFDDRRNLPTVPATVRVPGIGKSVTGRIVRPGGNSSNEIDIYSDFRGRWNGLTVLGLRYSFLEESEGYQATGIRFAEPVAVVTRKLREKGFVVNLDGSMREQVDKVDSFDWTDNRGRKQTSRNIDGVITSVASKNGETMFLCDEVFYASYGE